MARRGRASRLWVGCLLGLLGVGLCGAGIAWACAPGNYGWSEPQAPPAQGAPPGPDGGQPSAPPSGPATPAPSDPPAAGGVNSPNAAPVRSPNAAPVRSPGRVPAQSVERRSVAQGPSAAPQTEAPAAIPTTSEAAVAAPTVTSGAAPTATAPERSGVADRAAAPDRSPAGPGGLAASQSASSATGDLWSGFEGDPAASLTPPAAGATTAGIDAGFTVGLAVLGLGTVALLAGLSFALALARRRRAPAQSARHDGGR